MIKYVPIDAVLNYIPSSVQEEVPANQLMSWAYQLFKFSNLDWKYNIAGEILEVNNHTAKLPDDLLGIYFIGYAQTKEAIESIIKLKQTNLLDGSDRRLIIAQQQLLENPIYQYFTPLKYIGSNKAFHHLSICDNCTTGFSVDKQMNCITLDIMSATIFILYKTLVKDNNSILVPDDPSLMQAMAYYAQSQYWLEKASRGDANANRMHLQLLGYATELFKKAKSLELFRNYSVNSHESLIEDRFLHQKLPVVSGMNRNFRRR